MRDFIKIGIARRLLNRRTAAINQARPISGKIYGIGGYVGTVRRPNLQFCRDWH
jgi:hypothetical protein